jgi:Rrf2 family protein
MKLSSKTITAIKMFIDLGEHYEEGYISLVDIANRKELSKKFLEQIVPIYKTSGLLLGTRGNQGGYRLAKSPNEVTLKDIIYISENGLSKENVGYAPIDDFLNQIDKHLEIYLEKKTLADLIEAAKESYSNNYCI